MVQIIHTVSALRESTLSAKQPGKTIGLVPTMGALHEGHLRLVRLAQSMCDAVIVSVFVNPLQFGPNEDFDAYPRTLEQDKALLETVNADILYAPSAAEMYSEGFATHIHVAGVSEGLCGASRAGHFDGVATVVNKLFMQTQAHKAFFGEKDYQQLCVIRQMVRDLDIPISIQPVPIMREVDGLAMSSRNRYLSEEERSIAPRLYDAIQHATSQMREGKTVSESLDMAIQSITNAGFSSVEYCELRDAMTLTPVVELRTPARLLVAARLGTTRLIDNVEV